jgi:hypothetical protein
MGKFTDKVKKTFSSVKKSIQKTIPNCFKEEKKKIIPEKQEDVVPEKETVFTEKETVVPRQEGLTYLAENPSIPFGVKCGEHHKSFDIKNRLKTLNNTSVPEDFIPLCVIKSKHCVEIERKIRDKFSKYRLNSRREFFGFKIGLNTSSNEFECIKKNYEKLLKKMVKKMHKYALKYDGEIIM